MEVIDPGHTYRLPSLDQAAVSEGLGQILMFVKREGSKFPGNVGHYPGTTLQEVLRVCLDRVKYLDHQIPDADNTVVLYHLIQAIWHLELRAARRHNRPSPEFTDIVYGKKCPKCFHIGCKGECHE